MLNKRKLGAAMSVAAIAATATWAAVGLSGPAGADVATGQVTAAGSTGLGGTWGPAQPVPGLMGLATGGAAVQTASINAIDCTATGNCAAAGSFVAAKNGVNFTRPFVVTETDGTWGNAQEVTGATAIGTSNAATVEHVSCGAPGDCTAAGSYTNAEGKQDAFLVAEASGAWGTATDIDGSALGTGITTEITSLSCPAAGECAAAGTYKVTGGTDQAFVTDEQNGAWGKAEPVSGQASLSPAASQSGLLSVSCAAPGDCTAAGFYSYESPDGGHEAPLLVTEVDHNWGKATPVPDFGTGDQGTPYDGGLDSISCPEATACTALGDGTYGVSTGPNPLHVFTVDEADGSWGDAHGLTIPGYFFSLSGISCSSAGNCALAGAVSQATDPQAPENPQAYVASESGDGNWSGGTFLSGIPAGDGSDATGVSCAPGGNCTVAGYYFASGSSGGLSADHELTATGIPGGSFGAAHPLSFPVEYGDPVAAGPDCAQAGYCVLAASSPGTAAGLPVLDSEATAAAVTLKAARPAVTYGAEQAETLTATVASPAGGTPAGTVTVTDGTSPVCTIQLSNRAGICTLTAKQLPAGTATLTATYNGDVTYVRAIGTGAVTVDRAATVTRLAFTPRGITFTGGATKLTVTGSVSSTAGTPNGWATVRVDGRAVPGCTNVPFSRTVSCKGTTAILAGGRHLVNLAYSGRGDFGASTSVSLPLTVSRARTSTRLVLARTVISYGHENSERLTISVSHAGSVYATGKVAIKAGRTVLCTIILSRGGGNCTLTTTKLRPGTYHLTAAYPGNGNYSPSGSASETLKVAF